VIIIIGPDGTGKTALAQSISKKYGLKYFHYTKDSNYEDYIEDMCALNWRDGVLDRHALCEYAYSKAMDRSFKFSLKQWHNLILTTLIQNPLIILCVHKPNPLSYSKDQYLPLTKWDECLQLYEDFLHSHHITHVTYDYATSSLDIHNLVMISMDQSKDMGWWEPMWRSGWGCVGSPHPKVLLVAERIGPNNTHNIPFEWGPTGGMLSDLLYATKTPLGKFAVTNLVKSFRRDTREPNDEDLKLLGIELDHLKPETVIFMGSVAKKGAKEATKRGIPSSQITHFGYHSHRGSTSIEAYIPFWKEQFGIVSTELIPL
jgi:hypothetical protein